MPRRVWGVEHNRQGFTDFYAAAKDDCLRIVVVGVGDRQLAGDLVAEAFTRAGAPLTCHPARGARRPPPAGR